MKHVEEAVAIRDRLLTAFDRASVLPPGPERRRLLTVAFVGGGFSGVEGFGELLSLATSLLKSLPGAALRRPRFHLVEANGPHPARGDRAARAAGWCDSLERARRRSVHLNARVHLGGRRARRALDRRGVRLRPHRLDGRQRRATRWSPSTPTCPSTSAAGSSSAPTCGSAPTDAPVPDAWAAGDDAAVPDLAVAGARRAHRAERAARRAPGQAARGEHRRDAARRAAAATTCTTASASVATLGLGPRHLPVPAPRHHGLPRLADAPRLPRARGPDVGAQVPGARVWLHGARVRPRHRVAALGAAPAGGVRGRRCPPCVGGADRRSRREAEPRDGREGVHPGADWAEMTGIRN